MSTNVVVLLHFKKNRDLIIKIVKITLSSDPYPSENYHKLQINFMLLCQLRSFFALCLLIIVSKFGSLNIFFIVFRLSPH
jgi:hypothetical protein